MHTKTALIVDDSLTAQAVLKKMLLKFDLQVDTRTSGEDALIYLRSKIPDVIFLDHMMPGLDGFQTLKNMKANRSTQNVPVIMYTSQAAKKYSNEAMALGAIGVISKQVSDFELGQILDRVESTNIWTDNNSGISAQTNNPSIQTGLADETSKNDISSGTDELTASLNALELQNQTIEIAKVQALIHRELGVQEKKQQQLQSQLIRKLDTQFSALHITQKQSRHSGFLKSCAFVVVMAIPIIFAQNMYSNLQAQQQQQQQQINTLLLSVQDKNQNLMAVNNHLIESFRIQSQDSTREREDTLFLIEALAASIQQSTAVKNLPDTSDEIKSNIHKTEESANWLPRPQNESFDERSIAQE